MAVSFRLYRPLHRRHLWLSCALLPAALIGCGAGNVVSSGTGPVPTPLAVQQGPQLGYAWIAGDQSLRPILGIAGSSLFGQSVVPAGTYALAAASVRSGYALLQQTDGSLYAMSLPSGSPQRIGSSTFPLAAQILFSPSGQNALLLTPGAASITLITSVKSSPTTQTLTAPPSLLSAAVSDTAQIAAVSGSGPYSVAILTGSKSPLATLAGFGGLNFLSGSDSLLVADSTAATAAIFRNTSTTPAPQALTSAALSAPIAIAGSQDGHYALVANGPAAKATTSSTATPASTLVRFDLTGGTAPVTVACTCQPAELDILTGNAIFRLTPAGNTTTWLVDATTSTPRTLFIPAAVQK